MKILNKNEFFLNKFNLVRELKKGALFIYPTDTIYGLGCNATLEDPVRHIRRLKRRATQPFSIIAPNKEWILKNCMVKEDAKEWIEKLPGPYTLILKLKNKSAVANNVNPGTDSIGVRIPDNWFTDVVRELGKPIVTTSVNITGEEYMTSLEDVDDSLKKGVRFIFYEGEKPGKPSTIVYLDKKKPEIKER